MAKQYCKNFRIIMQIFIYLTSIKVERQNVEEI